MVLNVHIKCLNGCNYKFNFRDNGKSFVDLIWHSEILEGNPGVTNKQGFGGRFLETRFMRNILYGKLLTVLDSCCKVSLNSLQ